MQKVSLDELYILLNKMVDIKQSNNNSTESCIITKTQRGICFGCEFEIDSKHFLRIAIDRPIENESVAYLEHRLNKDLNIINSNSSRVKGLLNEYKQSLPNQFHLILLRYLLDEFEGNFNQIVSYKIFDEIMDELISKQLGPYSSAEDDAVVLKKLFLKNLSEGLLYLLDFVVLDYYIDENGNPISDLQNKMYQKLFFSDVLYDNENDSIALLPSFFLKEISKGNDK